VNSDQPPGAADARLDRLRGRALPVNHNARTIAALAANPGCPRRALMDAAGVDKQKIAAHIGYPAPFGQSRFAITRGNAFEAQVKGNGAAIFCLSTPAASISARRAVAHPAPRPPRARRQRGRLHGLG
jgi:hypothetical protein